MRGISNIDWKWSKDFKLIGPQQGRPFDVPWPYQTALEKAANGEYGEASGIVIDLIAETAIQRAARDQALKDRDELREQIDTAIYDVFGIEQYPNG